MGVTQSKNGQPGVYNSSDVELEEGQAGSFQFNIYGHAKQTLAERLAGEDEVNDTQVVEQRSTPLNVTSSQIVKTGAGRLKGIFVASASNTPTIKLWNSTSAANEVIANTFTPTGATFYQFPGPEFNVGLYITIGGTVDCTVFYS